MRMQATKSAKAAGRNSDALEIGQFDAATIAHHHVFNTTLPVNQHADLASGLVRELGQLTSKLCGNDFSGRDPPRVEFFDAAQLIRLQSQRVSQCVTDTVFLP